MEEKLRAHMDELFRDAAPTEQTREIKEEILQNITDKYHDLLAEGKSEQAAYQIAISGIGDLDELLTFIKPQSQNNETTSFSDKRTMASGGAGNGLQSQHIEPSSQRVASSSQHIEPSSPNAGASSQYVKTTKKKKSPLVIALIVCGCLIGALLIAALICGLLGVPILRLGGVEIFSGTSYANADQYICGDGVISGKELSEHPLKAIHITWVSGNVRVFPSDSNSIKLTEKGGETLSDKEKMHYYYHNGTLDIQYGQSGFSLFRKMDKDTALEVALPAEIFIDSEPIDLTGSFVSSEVSLEDITADQLSIDTVSGNVTFTGSCRDVEFDSVSADLNLSSRTILSECETDTVSGNVTLKVPDSSSFHIEFDSVSGQCSNHFSGDEKSGGEYEGAVGENPGKNSYEFDSVSGDVDIAPLR